jgi:fumarate reductase flavoprotein subunit
MTYNGADYGTNSVRPVPEWALPPAPIKDSEIFAEYSADVVIVGAGHAGTCAARAAAEAGASVIVIEQQSDEQQWVLGIGLGVLNSKLGLERGLPYYEPSELIREWQLRHLNKTNPNLVRQYAQHSGETFDWLLAPMDKTFIDAIRIPFYPPPKYFGDGTYGGNRSFLGAFAIAGEKCNLKMLMKASQKIAKDRGARFFFGVSGEQLVKGNGRVTGIIGKDLQQRYLKFNAKKGVLLSAGDFSRNETMLRDLYDDLDSLTEGKGRLGGGMGWDGKGIRMGLWAGGRLDPGPRATDGGGMGLPEGMSGPMGATAMLRLNEDGKRFTDESFTAVVGTGSRMARQPAGKISVVWDSNWREELEYQMAEHGNLNINTDVEALKVLLDNVAAAGAKGYPYAAMRPGRSPAYVYAADNFADLAVRLGYTGKSAQNFVKSIERYNELARRGKDEDFAKDSRFLRPLEKAPYFGFAALKNPGSMTVTLSGLRIDENQQVLGEGFKPIPGLFASGNCSGGRFAMDYTTPLPGCSIGMAQTLGRIAGKYIANL